MDFQNRGHAARKKGRRKIRIYHLAVYIYIYIYKIETQKERKERSVAYEMLEINV